MITIFGDFRQFSAAKLAFFSKTNVMINFSIINLCFESKTPIFSWFFWRKYLKNHNIGPRKSSGQTIRGFNDAKKPQVKIINLFLTPRVVFGRRFYE
jgi:hypothetical protein